MNVCARVKDGHMEKQDICLERIYINEASRYIYNTSFTWYIFGGFAFLCTATKHSLCIPYKENIVQYANL